MSDQQSDREGQPQPEDGTADGERVIHVSWQAIVMPLAIVLVVGAGWALGRWIGSGGTSSVTTAQSNAVEEGVAPANAGQTGQVAPSGANAAAPPSAANQINVPPPVAQPAQQDAIGADQVFELPDRYHPLTGSTAPDFTMTLLETGEEVSLSDYRGKPVLVNFWATWCPPCRHEMPWLQAMHQKYRDQGFTILAVDAGEKVPPSMVVDTIQRYIDSAGLTFPVLYGDSTYDVQREWTVLGLPGTFLIDEEGTVVAYHQGMYPNRPTMEDHILRKLPSLAGASVDGQEAPEG